ncbi:putative aromatic acid transporter [Sphingobium sp. SYK-6]|nr:putative aromatic acid transporter [Sphingobium sp. SYK-6]
MPAAPDTSSANKAMIDVAEILRVAAFGRYHLWILILSCAVTFFDGLDFLLIAYTLPYIRDEMHLSETAMGYVSAAAFVGQMIGALAGAYLADLLGRKPIILTCTMLSAFLTFSTGFAQTPETLMILRLLAGLTIGGLLAPAWSLNIEVMPRAMRATSVTIIMLGFSLGASASGALTNLIAPHLGWHAVFFLCGALTLILALVLLFTLPESVRWMVAKGKPASAVLPALQRLAPNEPLDRSSSFYLSDEASSSERTSPAAMFQQLFKGWLAYITPLIWVAYFCSSFAIYLKTSFGVLFLEELGLSVPDATWLGAVTGLLGALGGVLLLALTEKRGPAWIALAPAIGAPFTLLLGLGLVLNGPFFIPVVLMSSIMVGTGHAAVVAMTGIYYPSAIRATGGGWASFVAKFASVAAPIIGAHFFLGTKERVLHGYLFSAACLLGVIVCVLALAKFAARLTEQKPDA